MQFTTTRFGEIEVDPDTIITFPKGMPGFESCTRYKLLHEAGKPLIQWLQSLDDPDLSFSVADPADFNIFYEFSLSDEEAAEIALEGGEDTAVFMMLYKPGRELPHDHIDPVLKDDVRANAAAPLVINMRKRIGLQTRLANAERRITIRERKD